MNKETVICPSCGSSSISRHEKDRVGQLTLGHAFSYKAVFFKCNHCNEEGDFIGVSDQNYLNAQKDAQIMLAKNILENMSKAGITMAMFERVFELPTRTLTRWKNGDFSASALALLRIVAACPWIIEVAEHKFERNDTSRVIIKVAADELLEKKNNLTVHEHQHQYHLSSKNPIPVFSNNKIFNGA